MEDQKLGESFEYIKNYIRSAESLENIEALKNLRRAWEGIDDCSGLAEARTRLAIGKLDRPKLAPEPEWLKDAENDLRSEYPDLEKYSLIRCLDDAKRLICGCINEEKYSKLDAEIYHAIGDNICVEWNVKNGSHQWIVRLSDIPWPGCLVNVLDRRGSGISSRRETLLFHDAYEVIDYFKEKVGQSI